MAPGLDGQAINFQLQTGAPTPAFSKLLLKPIFMGVIGKFMDFACWTQRPEMPARTEYREPNVYLGGYARSNSKSGKASHPKKRAKRRGEPFVEQAKYFRINDSDFGAIKTKEGWIGVKNLGNADLQGWKRVRGMPSSDLAAALSNPDPVEAANVVHLVGSGRPT